MGGGDGGNGLPRAACCPDHDSLSNVLSGEVLATLAGILLTRRSDQQLPLALVPTRPDPHSTGRGRKNHVYNCMSRLTRPVPTKIDQGEGQMKNRTRPDVLTSTKKKVPHETLY